MGADGCEEAVKTMSELEFDDAVSPVAGVEVYRTTTGDRVVLEDGMWWDAEGHTMGQMALALDRARVRYLVRRVRENEQDRQQASEALRGYIAASVAEDTDTDTGEGLN